MADARELVEHLFRREYSRLIAGLVRVLGPGRLELAEDVVQDALHRALRTWAVAGIPDDPSAWLLTVARNRALDLLRRERVERAGEEGLARWSARPALRSEEAEDALLLLSACCHPALAMEARAALTLKVACGFGVREIARALLASEDAVAQRLVRARRRLAEVESGRSAEEVRLDPERSAAVIDVLYLLFNEGYSATSGEEHVRAELLREALRLGRILHSRAEGSSAEVDALLALQLFQAARIPARVDSSGRVVTLARQDRSLWDREMLAEAWARFERACGAEELTPLHVEAAIAAAHSAAPSYAATDWRAILDQYDLLLRMNPSWIVAMNRAVAVAKVHGVGAGLDALEALATCEPVLGRLDFHAARGLFLWHAGRRGDALDEFRRAAAAGGNDPEHAMLAARIAALESGAAPEPF